MTMTDFDKWYNKFSQGVPALLSKEMRGEFKAAYKAGAASQAGTLRDHFAGQAMAASLREEDWMQMHDAANFAYEMADAMLEARKTTGEGE
jgi:hypothetical protein